MQTALCSLILVSVELLKSEDSKRNDFVVTVKLDINMANTTVSTAELFMDVLLILFLFLLGNTYYIPIYRGAKYTIFCVLGHFLGFSVVRISSRHQ